MIDSNQSPILIYQMGKVGSKTVYESLKALNLATPVYHTHLLNKLEEIEKFILVTRSNPEPALNQLNSC